jgi:diguanylate cyclase (GGDEF)-like protein/PAS domain S-box-containing protein
VKEGHVLGAEREFVRKDGTILPVQLNSTAIYDEDGKFLMSRSVLTDITERKKVEEVLRIAGVAFESQEGMMVTDADSNILRVNKAFTEITGYSESDAIGKNPNILSSGCQDAAFYKSMWKVINRDGSWSGEIWNRRKSGEMFPEQLTITAVKDDDGRVTNYVGSLLDITERKISEAQIRQLAYYDYLTGLPNRRLFRDRLEQDMKRVIRKNTSLALLFLDLDRFKEVNDTLGHDKGDILLTEASSRIRQHVRDTDTLARLGGDEFTIILPEYGERSSVDRVVQNVVHDLAMPFDLGNGDVGNISCSVGIALYPQDAGNIEDLLKHADQAMYAAKLAGRNGFSYFTRSMQHEATKKMALINDLHVALERGQMEVYFQPIVDARSGEIIKAEALLRWHHPVRGMVSPDVFIPLAEECGLILEIGEWVFEETLKSIAKWQEHTGKLVQVSVNKSPVQFMRAEAHPWIENYLKSGLPSKSITVEITEGLLLSESEKVKLDFINFRENGIELSIDDFGTGFSALSYLNRFDVDYLKIDKAFVQKMTVDSSSRTLTEAIVVMAHTLGIRVIAEGVEMEEQRELLKSFGCDYLQGFLFSKPVPANEFEKLLAE